MKMPHALLLASALAVGTAHATDRDDNRGAFTSKSVISAAQEVNGDGSPAAAADPETGSQGIGNAVVRFNAARRALTVQLTFSNLSGELTRLHFHCAPEGQNGPVGLGVIDLRNLDNDNSEDATVGINQISATLRRRDINPSNGCGFRSINDVFERIQLGEVYVNLHTTAFEPGELRGQIEYLTPVRGARDD